MFKRFFSSSDARKLKEKSNLTFEEVSDGIYLVVKDRTEKYDNALYVTSKQVIEALNHIHDVVVLHRSGSSGYANFTIE